MVPTIGIREQTAAVNPSSNADGTRRVAKAAPVSRPWANPTARIPYRLATMLSRIPVNAPNIVAAADVIDAVTLRLHSPRPVGARGVARLRRLLADGSGPLYRYGSGDLTGRLRAALAAL